MSDTLEVSALAHCPKCRCATPVHVTMPCPSCLPREASSTQPVTGTGEEELDKLLSEFGEAYHTVRRDDRMTANGADTGVMATIHLGRLDETQKAIHAHVTTAVQTAIVKERERIASLIEEHDWPLPIEDFMRTQKHLCGQLCREIARGVRTGKAHDDATLITSEISREKNT